MGKKTLEEIGKILLVSIISILITTLTARRVLLDSKVDKIEYKEDWEKDLIEKKAYRAGHEKRHDREMQYNKETHDMVLWMYQEAIKNDK